VPLVPCAATLPCAAALPLTHPERSEDRDSPTPQVVWGARDSRVAENVLLEAVRLLPPPPSAEGRAQKKGGGDNEESDNEGRLLSTSSFVTTRAQAQCIFPDMQRRLRPNSDFMTMTRSIYFTPVKCRGQSCCLEGAARRAETYRPSSVAEQALIMHASTCALRLFRPNTSHCKVLNCTRDVHFGLQPAETLADRRMWLAPHSECQGFFACCGWCIKSTRSTRRFCDCQQQTEAPPAGLVAASSLAAHDQQNCRKHV